MEQYVDIDFEIKYTEVVYWNVYISRGRYVRRMYNVLRGTDVWNTGFV